MATEADSGFTLVELLIAMLIVGVLSSIAIPVFATQREMAHDSATKSDVVNVGQEIATYHVDARGGLTLDLDVEPGKAVLSDGVWTTVVNLTKGTAVPNSGRYTNLDNPATWCVSLTDPKGRVKDFKYTAQGGLATGTC